MKNISLNFDNSCYYLKFQRNEKGNALNSETIIELQQAIYTIKNNDKAKCLIISAPDKNFCTGLDLNWLKDRCSENLTTIQQSTANLESFFKQLNDLTIIKIAIANGKIIGAGVGIVACCDLVFAKKDCQFYLPEIKIGILPAVILPYLAKAIGRKKALAYALSQKKWSTNQALNDGLVHEIIDTENSVQNLINNILTIPKSELTNLLQHNHDSYSSSQLLAKIIFRNKHIIIKNLKL